MDAFLPFLESDEWTSANFEAALKSRLPQNTVWPPDAMEQLFHDVGGLEAWISTRNETVMRLVEVVRVRVFAAPDGRHALVRAAAGLPQGDARSVRTFLGATLPLRLVGGRVEAAIPPAHGAAMLVHYKVLKPLGLDLRAARFVLQSEVETDLAPDSPHELAGVKTRALFHFFDCFVDFRDGAAADTYRRPNKPRQSADVEARLNARNGKRFTRMSSLRQEFADVPEANDTYNDAAAAAAAGGLSLASALSRGIIHVAGDTLQAQCRPRVGDHWFFAERAMVPDVPVAPPPLPQLATDLKYRFGNELVSARQCALLTALFPAAGADAAGGPEDAPPATAMMRIDESVRRRVEEEGVKPKTTPAGDAIVAADRTHWREELLVALFPKVVDAENFHRALRASPCSLSDRSWLRSCRRLGPLNLFDPAAPDGLYDLELRYPDERRLAGVLVKLAFAESLTHVEAAQFRLLMDRDSFPGWEVPINWDVANYKGKTHSGVPATGRWVVVFNSEKSDKVRPDLRKQLQKFFRVGLPRPGKPESAKPGGA